MDFRRKNPRVDQNGTLAGAISVCQQLAKRQGVHSMINMNTGGFRYIDDGDTAQCDKCGLEVSGWTADMKPFSIHAERSPRCMFVCSILKDKQETIISTTSFTELNLLSEVKSLKQVREGTFSHWPHRTSPSNTQMIEAGFFSCNVGDRVLCLYCNLICERWAPNSDDPWEVHKTFSPKCVYVIAKLKQQQTSSSVNASIIDWSQGACHPNYVSPKMRHTSFARWSNENSPSVDDLVRAGFFYTGTKTIVTCFYCNGRLQNWSSNDNPMIEHARQFLQCAFAKQICGDELYRKIKKKMQSREKNNNCNMVNVQHEIDYINVNGEPVQPSITNNVSPVVAARLDLPISQSLLDQNYHPSVIKRCLEDQFRLKNDDFISDCDFLMACMIHQKQLELGVEEGKNIIIPNEYMRQVKANDQTEVPALNEPSDLCVVCSEEKKRLACIPCGHLATCVSCGHSLRLCPICRTGVDAFVRIYI